MDSYPKFVTTILYPIAKFIVVSITYGVCAAAARAGDVEVLKDGNVRDRQPLEIEIAGLLTKTRNDMVVLSGGTFDMGDWGEEVNSSGLPFDASFDSKPSHEVRLDSFSIAKYPVTYAEFDVFTAVKRLPRINQSGFAVRFRKPDNPAGVTWQGAYDYCAWLAKISGQRFSLPTEAQWEYAARSGGKRHLYATDNGRSEPGRNVPSYEQAEAAGGLVTVASFPPNEAGIHYMGALIREWVGDWYAADYYQVSPVHNPRGPQAGSLRVIRGFFGSDSSALTFKRWTWKEKTRKKSWTRYPTEPGEAQREIPITRYSKTPDDGFRCVLNHVDSKPPRR